MRVVIKDLGGLARREDLLSQQVNVLVETSKDMNMLLATSGAVAQKIRTNIGMMRQDMSFDVEDRQVRKQSLMPREISFMKFYQVPLNTQVDVAIVDGEQLLLRFALKKLYPEVPVQVTDKKIILKYQNNFNLLVISSDNFSRREERESGRVEYFDHDEMEDSAKDREEKRKEIIRKRNPFNNRLNDRDKTGFQPVHQDSLVSNLINITTMNSAHGGKVLEGLIRQANVLFIRERAEELEKNEAKRREWTEKLTIYHNVCRGFLQYRYIEQEILMDEAMGEGGMEMNDRVNLFDVANHKGKFSFNEYEIWDIGFFERRYSDNIAYLLPNSDINNKLFLALSPKFVLSLFTYEPKKNMANNRQYTQLDMIKVLPFYIRCMADRPETLFTYFCKCMIEYARLKDSFGTMTLRKSLEFMRTILVEYQAIFVNFLSDSDRYRRLYFIALSQMVFSFNSVVIEPKMNDEDEYYIQPMDSNAQRQEFSEYVARIFLLDTLIPDIPQLHIEFFNTLFSKKDSLASLRADFYIFYLNYPLIRNDDKISTLKQLFNRDRPMITTEMTLLVYYTLTDNDTLTTMTSESLITIIDDLYDAERITHAAEHDIFTKFMRSQELCLLHRRILLGFAVSRLGHTKSYIKNNSKSYFVSLYNRIQGFLKDLKKDILIEFIGVKGILNERKIELFEVIYAGEISRDPQIVVRSMIREHIENLTQMKSNIDIVVKILTTNEIYFNEYRFFDYHRNGIRDVQTNILGMTVQELNSNPVYKQSLVLLNAKDWEDYNKCQNNYRLFYESLKSKCKYEIELPSYYDAVKKTTQEFTKLFDMFAEKNKFTLADYDKYLPRVTFQDLRHQYTETMTALHIPADKQQTILENGMYLHSLNKVLKIYQPMKDLSASEYLNLKKDKFSEGIEYIYNLYSQKDKSKITVADLIKNDKPGIIKTADFQSSLTYLMPMVLKDISKSFETYKFVKDTADEFIRSMREECDNENLDVVNKLDVINKNIKFLVTEKSFENIVKRFVAVPKGEQRKIKKYLRDLNGQIQSNVTHLADRTKKDQNYNQKIINQMLDKSTINIRFNKISKRFVVTVLFEERGSSFTIQTVEFEELLNKAKIISENTNSQNAFNDIMRIFSIFGVELEKMCANFLSLQEIGLIHTKVDLLVPFMNKASGQTSYFESEDEFDKLKFVYEGASGTLKLLQATNSRLSHLEQTLSKELLSYYSPECYLMTYFYGKKLFYLTEYLRQRASPDEQKETIALITESIPHNLINFKITSRMPDDLYKVFNVTFLNLREWSANIKSKDKIKLNTSSVFNSKKIKTCSDTGINVYRTMSQIIYEAKESMVSLSQMLFCKSTTSKNQIISFCRRALLDPFKRIYFILSIDKLEYLRVMDIKNALLKIIESKYENLNFNLLIFNNQGKQTKNMFDNENFENINHSLSQLASLIKDEDFQGTFANLFKTNMIVMSEQAGMGKTTYIRNELNNRHPMHDLFLSGEMNKNTVKRRLKNLTESSRDQASFALTVKIDFIEDFDSASESIDYLLFCICIVRKYYTEVGCRDMRENLALIYIELSNTFITEALTKLSFLDIMKSDDYREKGSIFKFRVVLPKFDLQNILFNEDSKSNDQVIANFLKAIDEKSIGKQKVTEMKSIKRNEYLELLKKYFMYDFLGEKRSLEERTKSTYAQYQFWLQSLARLATELESVTDLSPKPGNSDHEDLRLETATEILHFCSYIINVSVDQAKMSQDNMKEVMSELKKKNLQKQNLEAYQQKFNKITPWSSKSLIVPLIFSGKAFFSLKSMEHIFNKDRVYELSEEKMIEEQKLRGEHEPDREFNKRFRQRMKLRDYIRNSHQFIEIYENVSNYSTECLTLLAKFLNQKPDEVIERAKQFKGKGFVITLDNFMKISLILLKSHLKIPIVMMGESGCGKTYLSEFVSECLMQDRMNELTLYSGVTELDFINFMVKAVEEANELKEQGKSLWVFFDEFNTSSLQSIVAEIMIDRVCSIEPKIYRIPENMIFISCCNPFRMKTKKAEVGLVPKTSDTILSHRVYPIPERLLNYIWDFGQLSEADEKKHIISMVAAEKLFHPNEEQKEAKFVNLIYASHKVVRNIEERSGVSLRDIKRVLTLYTWFRDKIAFLITLGHKTFKKGEIHLRATLCAILVAYGLRLNGRDAQQGELITRITNLCKDLASLTTLTQNEVKQTLAKMSDIYLQVLSVQSIRVIPENIALNRPLKENFITMLACYDSKIPLIICGAPGTSKTLCTQIFDSAMITNIIKANREFEGLKGIHSIYYGGSQTSTSEGISKVFYRAEQYLKQHGEDRPVVVFDEIGLAELSPHNPLKILHPLLEKPNQEVGFFGLSNWTLDLSKMNRLIYLARPDMSKDDLIEIFNISISGCKNDKAKKDLSIYLGLLAETYLDYRVWQKENGSHPNFHGSRDIYGVSKFVYNSIMDIQNYDTSSLKDLIKKAIERNFNGAAYLFGKNENELSFDTVPSLADHKIKSSFNNARVEDIGNPYGQARQSGLQILNIFSSSQIFKRIFMNKVIQQSNIADLFKDKFFEDEPIFDLIVSNIKDKASRFLLVKSEGEVVDNIFMERLSKLVKPDMLRDWRGIKGKENSHELLSTLKSYISLGFVVVMKNLDELYGSLYDLFNQKYSELEGRKYCYLYFGENKHKVEVHPDFKAIILLDAESELQGLELELEQPAPFLNRFEKFFVRLSNILTPDDVKEVYNLVSELQESIQGDLFKILGLSIDMLTSIVLKSHRSGGNMKKEITEMLMRLATSNFLLSDSITEAQLSNFHDQHPYSSIWQLLNDMTLKPYLKSCLFTFSNPIELEYIKPEISRRTNCKVMTSEELINQGLESRSERMKRYDNPFMIIQFTMVEHISLITQLKTNINENSNIKRCLFVIHLDRRAKDIMPTTKNIGLNFWHEWDNCVIENINGSNYSEMKDVYDLTLTDLLLSERHSMGMDIIKEASLSALQRIILEKNDEHMKHNFQAVREMIQNDPENTFAAIVAGKINQSKLMQCDEKWRALVSQNKQEQHSYSDIKSDILHVVNLRFGDIFKKYMGLLNDSLTNLASYALKFYDKDPSIQRLYRKSLTDKINAIQLNKRSLESVKYGQTYYRVPFLNEEYTKFSNTYGDKIIDQNKEVFYRLSETETRYNEYTLSKNQDMRVINDLKNTVLNGETFVLNSISGLTSPLFESIKRQYPDVHSHPAVVQDMTFDLIFAVIRKWEEKTERKVLVPGRGGNQGKPGHSKILHIMQTKYKFFRALCQGMLRAGVEGNEVDNLLVVSAIVSICYQSDMKYVFGLIEVSNIEFHDFRDLVKSIGDKLQSPFRLNYEVFNHIIKNLQGKVIPDFKDEKINLKFLKNKYAEMISESLRNSNEKSSKNYDLKYMIILLDLIEILPYDESTKYLTEISQTKKDQDRLGGSFDIRFVKKYINKILAVIHQISNKPNIESLTLIVSEYVNTNAQSFNFNLFTSSEFDNLFSILDERQQEKIASSLAHDISNNIDSFYGFEDLQNVIQRINHSRALSNYNILLSSIDTSKKRNMDILVSLIDKLYFNGLRKVERLNIHESLRIFEFLQRTSNFTHSHTSLENIIRYTMIRLTFNPAAMSTLYNDEIAIQKLDSMLVDSSTSKENFIENPNSFPFIYFLQEMIVETGDMARFQLQYRSVTNICGVVMDQDASGSVVFFDKDIQTYYIEMNNKLSDYAYNGQIDKISSLMAQTYQGNANFNLYVVGIVLLNKFINPVSEEDTKVVQNVKNLFMKALSNVQMSDLYKKLLFAIIRGDRFNFQKFLGDDIKDPNFDTRLKKVFYQFLLIAICFADEVGYDLNFWEKWCNRDYDNSSLKAQVVSTDAISNMGSIFENIVVERLSDGSYMDHGRCVANLGIYKCSCDYVYSIGNCGYAMVTRPCPKCGKEIGGSNHTFVQRKGHDHVKSLEDFSSLIEKVYSERAGKYNSHTVINKSSLEMTPIKLRELGVKGLVDALKNRGTGDVLSNFMSNLTIRHMFDHMLIISLPEILDQSDASKFSDSLKYLLPYDKKDFKEIMGRMAGRIIENHTEYFLAHVKNDIESLSQMFNFRNPVQIFDYLRAIMSTIAEKILIGKKMTKTDVLIEQSDLSNPADILPREQEIASTIQDNELDLKCVFKSILFRNIKPGLISNIFQRTGKQFEHIYKFMRHNDLNTNYIIGRFNQRLGEGANYSLLKNVVNYQDILKDFPVMVDANVKIAQHFNLNYDRAYNFGEASELDIMKLEDPALKRLYADFQRVWNDIIPVYEDKFPEVFSFAFMCQQNLNVKDFVDGILTAGGAKMRKFLFIDPKEYSDVNLLYMSSIVRTFVDKFHNMIIEKINRVLKLDTSDERNVGKKNIEYCSPEDYVSYTGFEHHVLNNFWYETSIEGENNIHFDMARIEYLCARDMKKNMINFDEKDIRYYNFKNTKLTEYESNLQDLIKKIRPIDLDPQTVKYFEELPEASISKSYEFILEVSNYVLGNFLFNDARLPLKSIVMTKPEASVLRFSSYDEHLHSKLVLGHLRDLYTMLKNLKFEWEVNNNRQKYNVSLEMTQSNAILRFCNDEVDISDDDLMRIKEEIRTIMLDNYQQGSDFLTNPLNFFGLDISHMTPDSSTVEMFGNLRGEQYLSIIDIMNQGIILKSKTSYLKKKSSLFSQ